MLISVEFSFDVTSLRTNPFIPQVTLVNKSLLPFPPPLDA